VPVYAAFLRGMNLGNRRITNAELCRAFAAIGFADARSFRASGNVAFSAAGVSPPSLAKRIEAGLAEELGYPVATYVRSAAQMRQIVARRPFADAELARSKGKLQVGLLARAPRAAARRGVLSLSGDDDRLALEGSELYWLPRGGLSESDLDLRAIAALIGDMTVRTMGTLEQMTAKLLVEA
jgi:uncharacterized protein (DUF1697 family)